MAMLVSGRVSPFILEGLGVCWFVRPLRWRIYRIKSCFKRRDGWTDPEIHPEQRIHGNSAVICDLFGMVICDVTRTQRLVKWPPTFGDKKVTNWITRFLRFHVFFFGGVVGTKNKQKTQHIQMSMIWYTKVFHDYQWFGNGWLVVCLFTNLPHGQMDSSGL